jgi:signal transduction histidine kinase
VQTERLVALANDLLVLARSAGGRLPLRREPLPVAEVLEAAALRARAWRNDREVVVADGVGTAGVFEADRLRIEQALDNLLVNALEHGDGRVRLDAVRSDEAVVLSVENEGAGLDPAVAQRAFDRFARGDVARAGSGSDLPS